MVEALNIHVQGIVQGVGFRPFVYRMAKKYLINGWVLNAIDGVHVHAEGESKLLDEFVLELSGNAPAAAQVTQIDLAEVPLEDFETFEIRFSDEGDAGKTTLVSPELAMCDDCLRELNNPNDRRYHYPFINCTNCGPRFTIIEGLPYDRKSTSMAPFEMCPRCAAEYADPVDRRFHAQPDACFECGPVVSFARADAAGVRLDAAVSPSTQSCRVDAGSPTEAGFASANPSISGTGKTLVGAECASSETHGLFVRYGCTLEESDAIFAEAARMLAEGKIVAVKGLGGFHLACDANNAQAIATLRERKHRDGKAFAVMMPSVEAVREACRVSDAEEAVLSGAQRPIVLLEKKSGARFAAGLADGLSELGVMLPYTPVQHLLLDAFAKAQEELSGAAKTAMAEDVSRETPGSGLVAAPMLVMTSGNLHDEPIVVSDDEAYEKLGGIADAFLGNNRAILTRFDDSVVRVVKAGSAGDAVQFIRRARGYAPLPVPIALASRQGQADDANLRAPVIFATGPEQKNTFALLREDAGEGKLEAFVSQHIGDMENAETYDAWLTAKKRFEQLFELEPEKIACDMHPEYLSSKWAHEQELREDALPVTTVQHHHAHIVSAMAENGLSDAVCGIAFDGTGFGVDGAVWGGEVLLANLQAFERFANFAYVPMPGGAAAVKHPLRMAYGVLWAFDLLEHPGARVALEKLGAQAGICDAMIEQGLNTPMTSSVGRLFDAASALLGVCVEPHYEGEAAILLSAVADAAAGEGFGALGALGSMIDTGAEGTLDSADSTAVSASAAAAALAPYDPAIDRYAIAVTKNVATETSTAQDTSVVIFDAEPTFRALLDDLVAGVPVPTIARRFHDALAKAVVDAAELVRALYGISTVVLSGGVFMNRYLLESTLAQLETAGFTAAINRELPPNDGCISVGQAVVAWAQNEH